MIGIVTPAALDIWQYWRTPTDEELASTPAEMKREWGDRFGAIIPKAYKELGPLNVFDGVCRLVGEGKIEIRCMLSASRRRPGQYEWRVEWRLTAKGDEYRRVH